MRVLAMVALSFAVAAAEYMYPPPPHLLHGPPHGPPPHGHGPPPHKHHHYSAAKGPGGGPGKHGPSRHPPPPHYHGRPHHWPRKPPPSLSSLSSPWKTSPFKAPKDPFRVLGSDADFGNQAAVLSALKSSGSSSSLSHGPSTVYGPSTATSPLQNQVVHAHHPWHRPANVISDDYGPIHTIPAPNLSAADKPSHLSLGSSYNALEQQALQRQAIKSALSQLTAAKLAGPTAAPVVHHTQGYQVSEPQTLVQEGATHLYAPDPDPSRPAPKLKPTLDPHSLPSEGRGPHFSIDPQFGAVSSHPGYVSQTSSLSPQDLFHLLNGFPLQHGMQPQQIEIMHHGLSGDALAADHQQLQQLQQLQQQHLQQLQQQHLQQQLQAQAAQSLHQLQPANFEPHYESFDFDEQSYQKSLFHDQQDHEGSEDAPRPSVQRPDEAVVQESSPSTVSLFTVPQPTSSTTLRGDIRSEDDHDEEAVEEYDDDAEAERPREAFRGSSTTPQQAAVTPAPAANEEDEQDNLQQVVEAPDSYSEDPSLTPTFRRQPNSVHVPEKQGRLPYGARIRPKRIAIE